MTLDFAQSGDIPARLRSDEPFPALFWASAEEPDLGIAIISIHSRYDSYSGPTRQETYSEPYPTATGMTWPYGLYAPRQTICEILGISPPADGFSYDLKLEVWASVLYGAGLPIKTDSIINNFEVYTPTPEEQYPLPYFVRPGCYLFPASITPQTELNPIITVVNRGAEGRIWVRYYYKGTRYGLINQVLALDEEAIWTQTCTIEDLVGEITESQEVEIHFETGRGDIVTDSMDFETFVRVEGPPPPPPPEEGVDWKTIGLIALGVGGLTIGGVLWGRSVRKR